MFTPVPWYSPGIEAYFYTLGFRPNLRSYTTLIQCERVPRPLGLGRATPCSDALELVET